MCHHTSRISYIRLCFFPSFFSDLWSFKDWYIPFLRLYNLLLTASGSILYPNAMASYSNSKLETVYVKILYISSLNIPNICQRAENRLVASLVYAKHLSYSRTHYLIGKVGHLLNLPNKVFTTAHWNYSFVYAFGHKSALVSRAVRTVSCQGWRIQYQARILTCINTACGSYTCLSTG